MWVSIDLTYERRELQFKGIFEQQILEPLYGNLYLLTEFLPEICWQAFVEEILFTKLFTKIKEEDIGNIWFQQEGAKCHTAESTVDVLRFVFEDRIISHRADIVWPPRSCDLTALDYYLWGAIKNKCHADKPETIQALKDNIREAIGEIQLHTIDTVLKNWNDRVDYCMASRASYLNEIIFHY